MGPHVPGALGQADWVGVNNDHDQKQGGLMRGTPTKYFNPDCIIPVTFLHKSSKQLKAKEAEQMWPNETCHLSDRLNITHSM